MRKNSSSVSTCKHLMDQWNWDLNNSLSIFPEKTSVGSQKKVYWNCPNHNNTYMQIIRDRYKGKTGCEICKKVNNEAIPRNRYIANKTPLADSHPDLVKEWFNCEKTRFTPQTTVAGSNVSVTWKCTKCGGLFNALISHRAMDGSGCPYCSGQKVLPGLNDLATKNPELAAEWSSKNTISPNEVTYKSNKKVFWICPVGHEDYLAPIKKRSYGQGCPKCAIESQTSFPEQAIFFYIKKVFPDAINRHKIAGNEIDIYIPCIKTGIEYNGYFYHKEKALNDEKKRKELESANIKLLVVKEVKYPTDCTGADLYFDQKCNFDDLDLLIQRIFTKLNSDSNHNIDCYSNQIMIRNQYVLSRKSNGLALRAPEVALEWDYAKNGSVKPEFVSYGSKQKYYWICSKCNSSYLTSVKDRVTGSGCPFCAGKKVQTGYNDLGTKYPDIAKEWDYDANGELTPNLVLPGYSKKVWWKCSKGHSWQTTINQRTSNNTGCPYCAGRKVLAGFNDLLSVNPRKSADWDYEKNELTPDHIHFNNQTQLINWVCSKCGYKWTSTVNRKNNCPNCQQLKRRINVYHAEDLSFYMCFNSMKELCLYFGLNYNTQHGNISSVCNRKQKTFLGKFISRYVCDDEYAKN